MRKSTGNHPRRRGSGWWLAGCALALATAFPARAAQTENHGLHAVPVPGPVVIDGVLDDWDLSGTALLCYDVETLRDVYSGRVAFMYDADNLYYSVRFKDPTPLGNIHDPEITGHRGWAGDAIQLRLRTDRITHLTAWHYAPAQSSGIHLDYGESLTKPFGGGSRLLIGAPGKPMPDGAEMAFKADADGKGYVQEMKIPWKLITLDKQYAPGESFRAGAELLWGEADWPVHRYADNLADGVSSREFFWTALNSWGAVHLEPKGDLELPTPPWLIPVAEVKPEGPVAITYTLPKDSRVTLALDDAQGRRVRNLLAAVPRAAGEHTELWDAQDDEGELVPPGVYTVKGLYHDGLHVNYLEAFATPGNPPWPTADGKGAYYGDHTAPQAVAFSGKHGALACPMGEAGQHLIGIDLEGRRQWGLNNRNAFHGGRVALATDGKILWIANADVRDDKYTIWRADLLTSRFAPWDRTDDQGRAVLDLPVVDKDAIANCGGIALVPAVAGSDRPTLAALVTVERRLLLLDAATGDELRVVTDLPEGAQGLAAAPDGTLRFVAGDALHTFDPRDAASTPQRLFGGLDAPQAVAVAPDGQRVYISERGARMNVGVYDAEGRRIAEIGQPGGRTEPGFFRENAMLNPAGIALDETGQLWVTEENQQPKRTSVWNAATGELVRDLSGTTAYCAGGIVNRFDPARGISEMVEYVRDPESGVWKPFFTLPDPLGTGDTTILKFAKVDGREYAQGIGTARANGRMKIFVRTPDGGWRLAAEFGNAGQGKTIDEARHAEWNRTFAGPLFEGQFGKAYLWTDNNDDGAATRDEMQFADIGLSKLYWGQVMGDDLTAPFALWNKNTLRYFTPDGFTAGGTPRFRFDRFTDITPEDEVPNGEGSMALGGDGRLYWNGSPLRAIAPDGRTLWTYPNRFVSVHGSHHAPAAKSGLLIGPSSIYGVAAVGDAVKEVFYLNGNLGQNFIFTDDGLWVQSLFQDTRGMYDVPSRAERGQPADLMTAGGESFFGGFVRSADGKYYATGGGTGCHVFEVTGLQSLARFGGTVAVADADLIEAQALKIRLAAEAQAGRVYGVVRVAEPLAVDADPETWAMDAGALLIEHGGRELGRVKAGYDADNLYLRYLVKDRTPLLNKGQDELLMFITGDAVDLMLRPVPDAPDAKIAPAPIAGDLRLLMSPRQGEPLATVYRPVSPKAAAEWKSNFSSPWRTIPMDEARAVSFPLSMVKVKDGYAVAAAIPWSLLGLENAPAAGTVLRGDFGILASDQGGQETVGRHYWSNRQTNNTNDIPDEVLLAPPLWGLLKFE